MAGEPRPDARADPARLAAARREVERFARERGAAVIEDAPARWRVERKPAFFRIGIYSWALELRPDGGLEISAREWRPDPS